MPSDLLALWRGDPGLETRLPVLFDAMVSRGGLGVQKFVELTATAPAQIYGLPGKGQIGLGQLPRAFAVQIAWLVALAAGSRALYAAAMRRLAVQGG